MSYYLMLVLGLAGIALIFIIQNVAAVDVNFLFWTISMSRSLLIIFTLAIGFLLGWFLHSYHSYRYRTRQNHEQTPNTLKDEG